jgi:hypothetical protein
VVAGVCLVGTIRVRALALHRSGSVGKCAAQLAEAARQGGGRGLLGVHNRVRALALHCSGSFGKCARCMVLFAGWWVWYARQGQHMY